MKRKALIISSYGFENTFMSGIKRDLERYADYLKSPLGGLWYSNEIVVLDHATISTITTEISHLNSVDYSFVVFTGHGYIDSINNSTICCLTSSLEINSSALRYGSKRQTLILDCCRQVQEKTLICDNALRNYASKSMKLNYADCRKYFDSELEACPQGLVVLCSCKKNETSEYDPENGGLYTSNLIRNAQRWGDNRQLSLSATQYAVRSIVDVHNDSILHVVSQSGDRQHPEITLLPRSVPYFPFVICA